MQSSPAPVRQPPPGAGVALAEPRPIFVFGSNLSGRHGKGAALHAMRHCGAVYGQGEGLQGQSYAIPTKDRQLQPLPLLAINQAVMRFTFFAEANPELTFEVTPIGCGLAGFVPRQIAPMFAVAQTLPNVFLPDAFRTVLAERKARR